MVTIIKRGPLFEVKEGIVNERRSNIVLELSNQKIVLFEPITSLSPSKISRYQEKESYTLDKIQLINSNMSNTQETKRFVLLIQVDTGVAIERTFEAHSVNSLMDWINSLKNVLNIEETKKEAGFDQFLLLKASQEISLLSLTNYRVRE